MEFMVPIAPAPSFTFENFREEKKEERNMQTFEGGWLQQFFDSAFFCEWIAVTYLYKQDNERVQEYLCKRMNTLPEDGIQDYLFQLCYLAVHKPVASLEHYLIDMCRHSLHASIRMHWFLLAELADLGKDPKVMSFQASCLEAALLGALPPLKCPRPPRGPSSSQRMLQMVSSASRRLLPLTAKPHGQEQGQSGNEANSFGEASQSSRRFLMLAGSKPDSQQGEAADMGPVGLGVALAGEVTAGATLQQGALQSSAVASQAQQHPGASNSLSTIPLKALVSGPSNRNATSTPAEGSEYTLALLKSFMPGSKQKEQGPAKPAKPSEANSSGAAPPGFSTAESPGRTCQSGPNSFSQGEADSPTSSTSSTSTSTMLLGDGSPHCQGITRGVPGMSGMEDSATSAAAEPSLGEDGGAPALAKDGFLRTFFWKMDEQRGASPSQPPADSTASVAECADSDDSGLACNREDCPDQHEPDGEKRTNSTGESSPVEQSSWLSIFKEKRALAEAAEAGGTAAGEDRTGKESSMFWRFFKNRSEEDQNEQEQRRALMVGELGVVMEVDESELEATMSTGEGKHSKAGMGLSSSQEMDPNKDSFLRRLFSQHRPTASMDGSEGAISGEDEDGQEGFLRKFLGPRLEGGGQEPGAVLVESSPTAEVYPNVHSDKEAGPEAPESPNEAADCPTTNAASVTPAKKAAEVAKEKSMISRFLGAVADHVPVPTGGSPTPGDSVVPVAAAGGAEEDAASSREAEPGQGTGQGTAPLASAPSASESILRRILHRPALNAEAAPQEWESSGSSGEQRPGAGGASPDYYEFDESESAVSPRKAQERTAPVSGTLSSRLMSGGGALFTKMFPGKGVEGVPKEGLAKDAELLIGGEDEGKADESAERALDEARSSFGSEAAAAMPSSGSLFRKFWTTKGFDPASEGQVLPKVQDSQIPSDAASLAALKRVESLSTYVPTETPGTQLSQKVEVLSKQPSMESTPLGITESITGSTLEAQASTELHRRTKSTGEAVEAGKQVLQLLYRSTVASAAGAASGAAGAARGFVEEAASLVRGKPQQPQNAQEQAVTATSSFTFENGVLGQLRELPGEVDGTGNGEGEHGQPGSVKKSQREAGAAPVASVGGTPDASFLKRLCGSAAAVNPAAGGVSVSEVMVGTPATEGEKAMQTPASAQHEAVNRLSKVSPKFIRRLFKEKPGDLEKDSRSPPMSRVPEEASPAASSPAAGTAAPAVLGQKDAREEASGPIPLVDAPPAPCQQATSSKVLAGVSAQGYRIGNFVGSSLFGTSGKSKEKSAAGCMNEGASAAIEDTANVHCLAGSAQAAESRLHLAPDAAERDRGANAEPRRGEARSMEEPPPSSSSGSSGSSALSDSTGLASSGSSQEGAGAEGHATMTTAVEATDSMTEWHISSIDTVEISSKRRGELAHTQGAATKGRPDLGSSASQQLPLASGIPSSTADAAAATALGTKAGAAVGLTSDVPAALDLDDMLPYPQSKLPKYPAFTIRKDTLCATLDFVKALGDISLGLVDVFPNEHRKAALQESLAELNAHLAQMSATEGVFFPMGKGLFRIVRIPEEAAVLLCSRERVPFMIFVEVLNCEPLAVRKKDMKQATKKLAKSGIPLSSGQTAPVLPRPPPWALHMWSTRTGTQTQSPSALSLSRTLSDLALDRAMASLYSRMKVVGVSFEVQKRPLSEGKWTEPQATLATSSSASSMLTTAESSTASSGSSHLSCTCKGQPINRPQQQKLQAASAVQPEPTVGGCAPEEPATGQPTASVPAGGVCPVCARGGPGGSGSEAPSPAGEGSGAEDESSEADTEEAGEEDSEVESKKEGPRKLPGKQHEDYVKVKLVAVPGVTVDDVASVSLADTGLHRRVPSSLAIAHVRETTASGQPPPLGVAMKNPPQSPRDGHPLNERMEDRKARLRKNSKFGSSPDWDLKCVIVKSGDDCRQEHLALQLVSHFKDIFQEAGLPLWLRPYEILVTSSRTALIETITDSASIHNLKGRYPQCSSLREIFEIKYGEAGTPGFRAAQQNFVESMAAYSIVSYLLQVRPACAGT